MNWRGYGNLRGGDDHGVNAVVAGQPAENLIFDFLAPAWRNSGADSSQGLSMRIEEYEIMFRVEDRHWWYAGLRAMIDLHWLPSGHASGCRLLDAGCGTGANLGLLSDRAWVAGVDYSAEAIRFCRHRGFERTTVGAAQALP